MKSKFIIRDDILRAHTHQLLLQSLHLYIYNFRYDYNIIKRDPKVITIKILISMMCFD